MATRARPEKPTAGRTYGRRRRREALMVDMRPLPGVSSDWAVEGEHVLAMMRAPNEVGLVQPDLERRALQAIPFGLVGAKTAHRTWPAMRLRHEWRAVGVQGFPAVGADRGGGAVGVEPDRPAPPVDGDQVVERAQQDAVLKAGDPALAPRLHMMHVTR